jgi:hypothetical protein
MKTFYGEAGLREHHALLHDLGKRALAVLLEIEWSAGDGAETCPECALGRIEHGHHDPSCALGAVVKEAREIG